MRQHAPVFAGNEAEHEPKQGRRTDARTPRPRRIRDAGRGPGVSPPWLDRLFPPESIIVIDIDPLEVERLRWRVPPCNCRVEGRRCAGRGMFPVE
jgi:trans-aconitate methyltransferase